MTNSLRLMIGGILALLSDGAVAQRSFSVVAGGQVHLMQARFVHNESNSRQLGLSSYPYPGFMLGVGVGFSPRYLMLATVGSNSYGINLKPQNRGSIRLGQQAREYSLVVRRHFPNGGRAGHVWYADLGVDALSAQSGAGILGFGASSMSNGSAGTGPGFRLVGASTFRNSFRTGLRLGAGREWAFTEHHHVALGLVASIGLSDLYRCQVQTLTWQQGENIDPVFSEDILATRFSFVGVQARYRFQL